jgi:hypothetical protein
MKDGKISDEVKDGKMSDEVKDGKILEEVKDGITLCKRLKTGKIISKIEKREMTSQNMKSETKVSGFGHFLEGQKDSGGT